MTDKQIIIDEIDVSRCEFYHYIEGDKYPHKCSCYKDMYGYNMVCNLADCCKNCYYKQLKRKEQECEGLRYEIGSLENDRDILQEQLDQLKSENEGFKILHKSDKGLITSTGKMNYQLLQEYDKLKAENKHLNDLLNQALKELEKTRETLTEIKEIAEKCCIMQAILDCEDYDDCTQCGRTSDGEGIQQILQKISEVIE